MYAVRSCVKRGMLEEEMKIELELLKRGVGETLSGALRRDERCGET